MGFSRDGFFAQRRQKIGLRWFESQRKADAVTTDRDFFISPIGEKPRNKTPLGCRSTCSR
jgi:hypothetical protein